MQELLANPAIQAAVAPFVATVILALLLRQIAPAWMGLAVLAGFLVTVFLTTGISLQPLTSTRKILLCGVVLPLIAYGSDFLRPSFRSRYAGFQAAMLAILLASAAVWIVWPVFSRQEGLAAWSIFLRVGLYSAYFMVAAHLIGRLQQPAGRIFSTQAASLLMVAIGTGVTTLIAASALYSQWAFALSAASGGLVLVHLFSSGNNDTPMANSAIYAVLLPLALIGASATVYAQLPGLVLLCLALVPLFARIHLISPSQEWLRVGIACLWASLPLLPAVWLAWRAAGPVSF